MLKFLLKAAKAVLYVAFIIIIVLAVFAKNILVEACKGIAAGARKAFPDAKRIIMKDPSRPITVEFTPVQ